MAELGYREAEPDREPGRAWQVAFWVLLLAGYALLRHNLLDIPLERDEGIFAYAGQVVRDGGLLYRDVVDHKPPLAFFLLSLATRLVPATPRGLHLFVHAYTLASLVALYFFAARVSGSRTVGRWTALCFAVFSSSRLVEGFCANTEMLLLLPLCLSGWCMADATRRAEAGLPAGWRILAAGVFAGLAVATKQTALFPVAAPAVWFGWRIWTGRGPLPARGGVLARAAGAWLAGVLLVFATLGAYFVAHGVWNEFVYWAFTHSYLYAQGIPFAFTLPRALDIFRDILWHNLFAVALGTAAVLVLALRRDSRGGFPLLFAGFSLFSVVLGVAYMHYFAQMVPALSLLAGVGLSALRDGFPRKGARRVAGAVLVLGLVAVPVATDLGYYVTSTPLEISRGTFNRNPFPESLRIAEYLAQHTDREDRLFIYGSEAQVYFYAERKCASRFAFLYPAFALYPRALHFQHRIWEDLQENRPKYVVVVVIQESLGIFPESEMWLARQVEGMLQEHYALDALVSQEGPGGSVEPVPAGTDRFDVRRYPIQIYRRK